MWKDKVSPINQKVADSLADPTKYENLFPGLKDSFKGEQYLRHLSTRPIPAAAYVNVPVRELNTLWIRSRTVMLLFVFSQILKEMFWKKLTKPKRTEPFGSTPTVGCLDRVVNRC